MPTRARTALGLFLNTAALSFAILPMIILETGSWWQPIQIWYNWTQTSYKMVHYAVNQNSITLYDSKNVNINSVRPSHACKHHWFRQWLVAWSAPSHHLNQFLILLMRSLETNFREILIEIHTIFIKNAFAKIVSENVGILFRPQCATEKPLPTLCTYVLCLVCILNMVFYSTFVHSPL